MNMSARKEPAVVNDVEVWMCPGCGEWKLRAEFYKSKHSANKLSSYCKHCQNKLVRKYQKGQLLQRKKEQEELTRLRARVKA
jgi:hypothetical protein